MQIINYRINHITNDKKSRAYVCIDFQVDFLSHGSNRDGVRNCFGVLELSAFTDKLSRILAELKLEAADESYK